MNAILVDDEPHALDYLERHLAKISNIEVVGKYIDPFVGKEKTIEKAVDVVFLDINLPKMNGLQLAEQILARKPDVTVVFVTACDEYAVHAFEVNALDYLVKPVRSDRLRKTIARIEEHLRTKKNRQRPQVEPIRVNVCRQLTVQAENEPAEMIRWRTARAQELFLYLLQHRGQLVRKPTIVELIWSDYELDKVYSQLYTTVYLIRKKLKPYVNYFRIENMTEGYILHTKNVTIDLEEWERGLAAAPPINMDTIEQYVTIMKMYKGDYLQEYDYWWAETKRLKLQQLWLQTAFQIADCYLEHGYLEKAMTWYLEICEVQCDSEEAHFQLMKIYAALGNHVMVERTYNELKSVLIEELNVPPSDCMTKWYKQWKKR